MQVEVAAKVATTDQPDLVTDAFLAFMLSTHGFQGAIPTTNWMYPGKLHARRRPARRLC